MLFSWDRACAHLTAGPWGVTMDVSDNIAASGLFRAAVGVTFVLAPRSLHRGDGQHQPGRVPSDRFLRYPPQIAAFGPAVRRASKGYFDPGPAVKDVLLSTAPPGSQKLVNEYSCPYYPKLIADVPSETPLPADNSCMHSSAGTSRSDRGPGSEDVRSRGRTSSDHARLCWYSE